MATCRKCQWAYTPAFERDNVATVGICSGRFGHSADEGLRGRNVLIKFLQLLRYPARKLAYTPIGKTFCPGGRTLLEQLHAGSSLNIINQPNNAVSTAVLRRSSNQRNKS